jgi:hypothetical protein
MNGTILEVRASSIAGLAEPDYPAVARWDWDSVNSHQYIGIKCGTAWCQVGNRDHFDTSASYAGPPDLPFKAISSRPLSENQRLRVTAIRGWYDEQLLDAANSYKPSPLRGILIPNPHIHNLNAKLKAYDSKWVQVGFAVVIAGDYHKWNYRRLVNEVLLCHGSASSCNVDENQLPEPPSAMTLHSCENAGWWASVQPLRVLTSAQGTEYLPDGKLKYFCLRETDHQHELDNLNTRFPDMVSSIPGTARWRWLWQDAGSWYGCMAASCCTKT